MNEKTHENDKKVVAVSDTSASGKKPTKDQSASLVKNAKQPKTNNNKTISSAKNDEKALAKTNDAQKTVESPNKQSNLRPQEKKRPIESRDSNTTNFSDLELEPHILAKMDRLTPIIDEIAATDEPSTQNKKQTSNNKLISKEIKQASLPEKHPKQNRFSSIRQTKTNAEILAREYTHDSYAEQYYAQNGYLGPWNPVAQNALAARRKLPFIPLSIMEDERLLKKRLELQLYDPLLANEALLMRSNFGNLITHDKTLDKWRHQNEHEQKIALQNHLFALNNKNNIGNGLGYKDIHEAERNRLASESLYFPGRYTLKDYRNLKRNMGLGMSFSKLNELDPETLEEKKERLNRGKEVGNKYMSIISRSRMSGSPSSSPANDYNHVDENRLPTIHNDNSKSKKNISMESANSLEINKQSDSPMIDKNDLASNRLKYNGSYLRNRFPEKDSYQETSYSDDFQIKNSYALKYQAKNWLQNSFSPLNAFKTSPSITQQIHFYQPLSNLLSFSNQNYYFNPFNAKTITNKISIGTRRTLRPNMHEIIYALADKNQQIFDKLSDKEIEKLNEIFFHERYTISDYKSLQSNMAFGKYFNRKKEYDFETLVEKRDRLERAKEVGNGYLKEQTKNKKKNVQTSSSDHHASNAKLDIKEFNFYLKHLLREKRRLEDEQNKPPTVQSDKNNIIPLSTNFTQDFKTKQKLEDELYSIQFNRKKQKEIARRRVEEAKLVNLKAKNTQNKNEKFLLSATETLTSNAEVDDDEDDDEQNDALTLFEQDLRPRNEVFDELLEAYDTLPPLPGTSGSNVVFVSHSAMKLNEDGYPVIDLDEDQRVLAQRRSIHRLPMSV